MDLAYANEQIYSSDRAATPTPPKDTTDASTPRPEPNQRTDLSTELSETFKVLSNSPWGAKLGGIWGNVQKQSQAYYTEAAKEVGDLRIDAIKGFNNIQTSLASRARSMSIDEKEDLKQTAENETTNEATRQDSQEDTETFLARFRAEAAKRLKDVQKAEDAADEALLRFGTNIRNFLRDAVAITAPEDATGSTEVIFESRDASGKRVIHTSRLDAQLHVIHKTLTGFTEDPADSGEQWTLFKEGFNIDRKTDAIASDLESYPELRSTMEQLVPEKVDYADFWRRYYFLRHILEIQEQKRRELLKASARANDDAEIGWDSDDEDERDQDQTSKPAKLNVQNANDSTTTLSQAQVQPALTPTPTATATATATRTQSGGLQPEHRRSHDEKSVADSEASYDIVSGAPSRAASSPKEKRADESDEDWE